MNNKELKKLRSKKFSEIKVPLMLCINKKNVDKYFTEVSNILENYNFKLLKNSEDKFWNNYIYDSGDVELSFNQIKIEINKTYPNIEGQENTCSFERIHNTSLKVKPSDENDDIFWLFELRVPYESL